MVEESPQDKIAYHNSTVGELEARYEAVQKRMDKLYDDKLDEKITPDFYNRKFKQYSDEKDKLTESIKRHSTANTGYLNLGINLYELSQRAREIYLKAKTKDMLDEQRALIRLVFAKLILDEAKLSWEYSKAFKILSEEVETTNCSKVQKLDDFQKETFEHREKSNVTGQKDSSLPSRPIWLERWYDFGRIDWASYLEYPEFTNKEVNRFLQCDIQKPLDNLALYLLEC